jgi:hypothetical protein
MTRSSLFGRRIHITGSIAKDSEKKAVELAREVVQGLVIQLMSEGATFVVPIDKDPRRELDGLPITFDWLVLESIYNNLIKLPPNTYSENRALIVAVQHYKNEDQIPEEHRLMWEALKANSGLVSAENIGYWNMNSKRLETQAAHGDVLICIGGDEGVQYLANLYHEAGKHVIPLNIPIGNPNKGAAKLWELALNSSQTYRFFQLDSSQPSSQMVSRLNHALSTPASTRVKDIVDLMRLLKKPMLFAVRLLNSSHESFASVDDFFAAVIKPVADEFGYELKTMDGSRNEEAFINQEIFNDLHRASAVVADLTGSRPNCFLELGYALARGIPTFVTAMNAKDFHMPFDLTTVPSHFWDPQMSVHDKKQKFRDYWQANARRRRMVNPDPLIP